MARSLGQDECREAAKDDVHGELRTQTEPSFLAVCGVKSISSGINSQRTTSQVVNNMHSS